MGRGALTTRGDMVMNVPTIAIDQIPGLEGAAALFGAALQASGGNDDRVVEIMVYLYENIPPAMLV
jgi:hypothetical protein